MLTHRLSRTPVFASFGPRDMDRLFASMFRGVPAPGSAYGRCDCGPAAAQATVIPLNAWQDEQSVYVEAEVPGIAMENLDISFDNGELTIKGKRVDEAAPEGVVFHRRERAANIEFSRSVRIPIPVDAEKIGATVASGVLLVTLPKAAAAMPRKISVSVK